MYLLEETDEAVGLRQHVCELLASKTKENILLARQLIEGGGMHPQFILPAWAAWCGFEHETDRACEEENEEEKGEEILVRPLLQASLAAITPIFETYGAFNFERLSYMNTRKVLALRKELENAFPACDARAFILYIYPEIAHEQAYFDHFYPLVPDMAVYMLEQKISDDNLYMHGSRLTCLPAEVGKFPQLKSIDISRSKIAEVPETFFSLRNLGRFVYSQTPLQKNKELVQTIEQRLPLLEALPILEKAKRCYYEGRYSTAADKMKEAVAVCGDNFEVWQWHGETHRMAGEKLEAKRGFEQALSLNKRSGYVWGKLAELRCGLGEYEEALAMCENFLQNPQNFEVLDSTQGDVLFAKGLCLFWLKRYEESVTIYNQSLALSYCASTLYNLACSYSKMDKKGDMLYYLRGAFSHARHKYHPCCVKDEDKDFKAFYEDEDFKALLAEFAGK